MTGTTPLPDRRRTENLERALERQGDSLPGITDKTVRDRGQKHIRIARTVANSGGEYPSAPANVFNIQFLDATASAATGFQTIVWKPRSGVLDKHQAMLLNGNYLAQGTIIKTFWDRGVNWLPGQIQWWIELFTPSAGQLIVARLCADMCGGTSDDNSINDFKIYPDSAYDMATGNSVDLTGRALKNPRGHAGRPCDEVVLAFDGRRDAYTPIDIYKHGIRPITEIFKRDETTDAERAVGAEYFCLTKTGPRIRVESCLGDLPHKACLILEFGPCDDSSSGEPRDCDLSAEPEDIDCCGASTLSSSDDCSSGNGGDCQGTQD